MGMFDWVDDLTSDVGQGFADIFGGAGEAVASGAEDTIGEIPGTPVNTYKGFKETNAYQREMEREMQRKADEFNTRSAAEKKAEVEKMATYFKGNEDYTSEVGDFFSLDQGRDISSHANYRFLYSEGGKSFYQDIGKEKKYGYLGSLAAFVNMIPVFGPAIGSVIKGVETSAEGEGFNATADVTVRGLGKAVLIAAASSMSGGNPIAVGAAAGLGTMIDEKTRGGGEWNSAMESGFREGLVKGFSAYGPEWGAIATGFNEKTKGGGTFADAIQGAAASEVISRGSIVANNWWNGNATWSNQPGFGGTYAGTGPTDKLFAKTPDIGVTNQYDPFAGQVRSMDSNISANTDAFAGQRTGTDAFAGQRTGNEVSNTNIIPFNPEKSINFNSNNPLFPPVSISESNRLAAIKAEQNKQNNINNEKTSTPRTWEDTLKLGALISAPIIGVAGIGATLYAANSASKSAEEARNLQIKADADKLELDKLKLELEKWQAEQNNRLANMTYGLNARATTLAETSASKPPSGPPGSVSY